MDRPVISFLSDFGPESAAAICRGVILSIARDAQIIDISHSVRKYAVLDGAYLLWTAVPWLPIGVHLVVIDPGVGTDRLPIAIRTGRGDVLVGPDNGVLIPATTVLGGIREARALENHDLMLPQTAATFHGRDIFAPVAAHLAAGRPFEDVGSIVRTDALVALAFPVPELRGGVLETTVAYVDAFGNLRLFATPADLEAAVGDLRPGRALEIELAAAPTNSATQAAWARTFGEVSPGEPLVYRDSSGLVAIGDNQGNASGRLGVGTGDRVRLRATGS